MRPHYLILDGTNVVYRAYHACVARLGADRVQPEHAVALGGALMQRLTMPLMEGPPPTVLAVFDGGGHSGRKRIYHQYKANRPPPNPTIAVVTEALIEMLRRLANRTYRHPDYEADDVIATLATQIGRAEPDAAVRIATGDRDMLQLIAERVAIVLIGQSIGDQRHTDERRFRQRYNFAPALLADYKALMGDPSDNIPGLPGIGQKTAHHLVQRHGGIADLYGDLQAVTRASVRRTLAEHEPLARDFLRLTTLIRDVPGIDYRRACT